MKTTFKSFAMLFLITFIVMHASAQTPAADTLVKRFGDYRRTEYLEKVYLHLSQCTFLVGETVWFSVYAVDGSAHKGTRLSKVAYVEILDQNNGVVTQGKISLVDGHGSGSFYLSPLINSGNYVIRAYTQWMRNQSAVYYYHKNIGIVNPFTPQERKKAITENKKIIVDFFPEGGNIIGGALNKIGFKFTATNGKGADAIGAILNEQNDTIVRFSPLKFGIGNFSFEPENGKRYRAFVKSKDGSSTIVDLPPVQTGGHLMTVTDHQDHFEITINNRTGMKSPSYVIAHARNKVVFKSLIEDHGQPSTVKLNKQELPDGITAITLFNAMMQPSAERLVYNRPTHQLIINAKTNQQDFSPRRPVTLDIETSAVANLSVSIYRQDSISIPSSSNIVDYLLLTSDLKGFIESPEYYLTTDKDVNQAIDNLMLTHGWRRFNWNDVAMRKNAAVNFLPEFNAPIITARLLNLNDEPAPGIITYLSSPSTSPRVYSSRSSADGMIQFEVQNFFGPRKLVIQPNTKTDSLYHVMIENPFSTDFSPRNFEELYISSKVKAQLQERSVAMQVNDIYHRARFEKFERPQIDSIPFYGKPDEKYVLDDFTRFPVMEEVLREYVPGVVVRKRRDGFHFMVVDHPTKTVFTESPLMLIDGVPFFDEDEIMSFNPTKIKQLDVMTQRYYLGYNHYFGVVSFQTYKGDLGGFNINKHALVVDFEGLQREREFYTPRYEAQKDRETRMPDQRHQLYWDPKIITAANGKQQVNFYTSDLTGNYIVVIEGLSKDGAPGATSTSFTVKHYNN